MSNWQSGVTDGSVNEVIFFACNADNAFIWSLIRTVLILHNNILISNLELKVKPIQCLIIYENGKGFGEKNITH